MTIILVFLFIFLKIYIVKLELHTFYSELHTKKENLYSYNDVSFYLKFSTIFFQSPTKEKIVPNGRNQSFQKKKKGGGESKRDSIRATGSETHVNQKENRNPLHWDN